MSDSQNTKDLNVISIFFRAKLGLASGLAGAKVGLVKSLAAPKIAIARGLIGAKSNLAKGLLGAKLGLARLDQLIISSALIFIVPPPQNRTPTSGWYQESQTERLERAP